MSLQGSLFDWLYALFLHSSVRLQPSAPQYLIILVATSYQFARPTVSTVHLKELVIK